MKYFVIFLILTGFTGISIENAFAEEQILIHIENDVRKLYYTGENIMSAFFDPDTASIIFETGESAYLDIKAPKIYKEGESLIVLRNGEEVDVVKGSDECFYYITYHTKVPEKIEIIFAHWPEATALVENCETFTVLSPLKQFKAGVQIDKIQCRQGLELIFKSSDNSPACVKPQTKSKLAERGWALEKTPDEPKPENPVTKLVLMDFVKQDMQNPLYFYKIDDLKDIPGLYEIYTLGHLDATQQQYQAIHDTFHDMCLQRPDANMMNCGSLDFAFEYSSKKYWIAEAGITLTPTKPAEVSKEITQTIVDANNQFALNFYSQVSQNDDENIFFSPISISTAFAIAYEGARQDTAEEIKTMFGFPEGDGQRRAAFQSLQSGLNENEEYSLSMANALWIKQGYEIRQEYIDTTATYYDSKVDNVDFVTDEGIDTINEWVKSKTHGKIEQLLEPGSTDELTRLVITNAIYFNGEWVHQFSPDWTRQSDFHVNHDKTVKVSMMDLDVRKLNYAQNESLEIIELPYKGEKISMLILLPKEIDGIKSLEEKLTAEKLSQLEKSLSETQIAVLLPKFTAETKYNLKNNLQDMGMKIPFDMYDADFSGINEREQLYIDEAVHKAFVGVNELGTEAAAATGIEVRATSGPPATFRADHPFIFLIQDNETGLILFMGKIVDPAK